MILLCKTHHSLIVIIRMETAKYHILGRGYGKRLFCRSQFMSLAVQQYGSRRIITFRKRIIRCPVSIGITDSVINKQEVVMAKFECKGCGYIFDEQQAGIKFSEIMECPICAGPREEFEQKEEEKKETKDEKKDDAGYVIEKRQEFWLEEKDKKPEKEPDRSNIETYYDGEGVIPVKTPEQLEKEAKEKEEAERPKLDPIEVTGTNIVERGDRSSDGSDSEVVVVDEATSDVDTGDDEKKEETEAGEEKAEEQSEETVFRTA